MVRYGSVGGGDGENLFFPTIITKGIFLKFYLGVFSTNKNNTFVVKLNILIKLKNIRI